MTFSPTLTHASPSPRIEDARAPGYPAKRNLNTRSNPPKPRPLLRPVRPQVEAAVSIRRAARAEMPMAADIIRSTAEWYRPLVAKQDMAEHAVDDRWAARNFLARECYFGRLDGEVVGFVTLQHCGEYIYVGYAYVPERFVGRGIGRQLLSFAARVAKERGYRGLVHIGHPDASWAVRAYEKLGYRVVLREREDVLSWSEGFLRPFYEEGFVLFQRDL